MYVNSVHGRVITSWKSEDKLMYGCMFSTGRIKSLDTTPRTASMKNTATLIAISLTNKSL